MTTTVFGSCPLDCPDACAWEVLVDDAGVPVRLRGRSDHPFTAGGLCPKVNPWLKHANDESRLLEPMRRSGPKGSGRFTTISWESAIDELAERLHAVIERHGGAAVWPFHGTGNLGWLQGSNGPSRVWSRMGASAHNMSICSVAGNVGMVHTVGQGDWMDAEDFVHSGLVVVWGSNTLVTNRHLWPFIEQARQRNDAPLVVVDPIRTRTAERADLHLAPQPGTDAVLALGICAELIRRNRTNEPFITERTTGWEAFASGVHDLRLGQTAEITRIPQETLASFVDLLSDCTPLGLRVGHGMQRHAHGGQAMRAVACVPAVLGSYDDVGGGSLYSGSALHKGYNLEKSRRPTLGDRPRTLAMTNLGRNLLELTDPPVDALVVWGANPMVSNPETNLVRRGLERTDLFTTVIDIHHTETVDFADLVLPSTMQHEQYELNDSYNHRRLALNAPAVEPAGSCLPHTEIFRRLATAMGYDEPELQASDAELIDDLLDVEAFRSAGVTRDRLLDRGHLPLPPRPAPANRPFRTPSGRFQFASEDAHLQGHGLVPEPGLAAEAASPEGGRLALIAAASEHHVNSTFAGTAHTRDRAGVPAVTVHPDDARAAGVIGREIVRVHNDRGGFEARLEISDAVRPGVVATTKGWWHHSINSTTHERDADMGSGAVFHDNAIRLSPAAD